MVDIEVHRYSGETGFRGWIEPADKNWILFIADDGTPMFFPHRDPKTGAVTDELPAYPVLA